MVVVPHFFYFFILFVIGDFVWSGLRKKIEDLGCSPPPPPVVVMVVVVVVAVADGRSDCGGDVDFF